MQNYFNLNHLLPNRLIFDRETAAPRGSSDADVWSHDEEYTILGRLDKRAKEKASEERDSSTEAELSADRRAALDRSALDAQKERDRQKAVIDAARDAETVKKRLVKNELFDSLEEREKMVKEMREALSENPDKWYKYVEDHQVYTGNYAQWNLDLMTDVLGKSKVNKREARKYVGALQIILAEDFAKKGVKFEQKEGKRINKFTYVNDGLIGPYTVSILSAYLTSDLYVRRNPEKAKNFAELGDKFGKTRKRSTEFSSAIASLEKQLAGNFSTRKAFPNLISRPELRKQAMEIRESLAGGSASEEALFAYEQAYGSGPITKRIGEIIRNIDEITKNEKGNIEQTPKNWQTIHDLLIATPSVYYSPEYEVAYKTRGKVDAETQAQAIEYHEMPQDTFEYIYAFKNTLEESCPDYYLSVDPDSVDFEDIMTNIVEVSKGVNFDINSIEDWHNLFVDLVDSGHISIDEIALVYPYVDNVLADVEEVQSNMVSQSAELNNAPEVKVRITEDDLPLSVRDSAVKMAKKKRGGWLLRPYSEGYKGMPTSTFEDLLSIAPPDYKFKDVDIIAPEGDYKEPRREGLDGDFSLTSFPNGSWPKEAFGKYKIAYEDWKDTNTSFERDTEGNVALGEEEIKAERKEVEKLKKTRDLAYDNLCLAVNEYYKADYLLRVDIADEYEQNLYRLALKYDFPEGNLNGDDPVKGTDLEEIHIETGYHAKYRKRHWYKYPSSIGYYFSEVPTKIIKDPDDLLPYYKGKNKEEVDKNRKQLGVLMKNYDFVEAMNHYIYMSNYDRFLEEKKDIDVSPGTYSLRKSKLTEIEPLDQMLARVKSSEIVEEDKENTEEVEARKLKYENTKKAYNAKLFKLREESDNWKAFYDGVLKNEKADAIYYSESYYDSFMKDYESLSVDKKGRHGIAQREIDRAEVLISFFDQTLEGINEYRSVVQEHKEKGEIYLGRSDFSSVMMEMLKKQDFDFNGVGNTEYQARQYFIGEVYDLCRMMEIPTSERVVNIVKDMLINKIADSGGNIDYQKPFKTADANKNYSVTMKIRNGLVEKYTGGSYSFHVGPQKYIASKKKWEYSTNGNITKLA